jgi:6-phosphogluconolactonase
MNTMPFTETRHSDSDALAKAVARRASKLIDAALQDRGRAVAAIAGGRTTPPVLRRLAAESRDWSRVTLLPTDERWVGADHVDCNLRQLQEPFAAVEGIRWVSLTPARPRGRANANHARAILETTDDAFDLCLLGMGADGHFASLFPGAENLHEALDLASRDAAVAIIPDPLPLAGPHSRISLSLARLLHSRHVLLAISGADKRVVLDRAMHENDPDHLPVAALLRVPGRTVEIHWSP